VICRRVAAGFLLFVIIAGSLYQTCVAWAGAPEHPGALVVDPCARQILWSKLGGTDQLAYHVKAWLPASDVIDWISAKLWDQNWRPLPYDSLEPNNASAASQVRGWHSFLDPTGLGCIQQWIGDWQDRSGNVVRYIFRYKLPKDCAPDSDDLEVFAVYTPALLVKQGQEAVKKFEQEHRAP
jgi:hypothetical protein